MPSTPAGANAGLPERASVMQNQSCILSYLCDFPTRRIPVRLPDGSLAFIKQADELKGLVWRGMVDACWNRYGFLKALTLLVSVVAARRAMKNGNLPPMPPGMITKPHYAKGKPTWPPRYDRAKCGRVGGVVGQVWI